MPGQEETTVFISYSRTDSDFVDRLEADLKARGFGTWVDRLNLEPGEEWPDVIQRKVEECSAMVVVLSQQAVESPWVKKEYHHALALGRPIIPAQLEPVPRILALDTIQRADFQTDYQAGLRTVLVALAQVGTPGQQPAQCDVRVGSDDSSASGQPAQEPQQLSVDDLYRIFADALANRDLDRADIIGEQIQALDPDGFGRIVAGQLKPFESELHDIRLKRLRSQADQARAASEWGQEAGAWQALLALEPNDEQALLRLPIAQHNRRPQYAKLYNVIKGLYDAGNVQAAKQQLQVLWDEAPYFGDPAGIAAKVGLSQPPTPEEVEETKRLAEVERKLQERIAEDNRQAEERRIREQKIADEKKQADAAAAAKKARDDEIERQRLAERQRQRDKVHLEELKKAWAAYNARKDDYVTKKLDARTAEVWVAAIVFVTTLAAVIFVLINTNLNLHGWLGALLTQGYLAELENRGLLRYALYAVALLVLALIVYGLGFRRGLGWRAMAIITVLGGIVAYGVTLIPASLFSESVRFYTFPFEGTLRVSPGVPWNFCLAFGMSYVILMFIPAIITVFIGSLVDDFGFGGGLAIAVGEIIGGFIIGFLLAIPVGFLGWVWGGLITGCLVGFFMGLTLINSELKVSIVVGVGIIVTELVGLLTWAVVAFILWMESSIVLLWFGGITAGMVAAAALGATLVIWFTRAEHVPKPKEKLPVAA